jgi:phosphatidylserine decarboxylase
MEIIYIDRKTGCQAIEKVYGGKVVLFLYGDNHWIKNWLAALLLPILACVPFFSRLYGYLQKLPRSRHKIQPFIESYGVDASEFATTQFASFNDFFIRKLKKEARPIDPDPNRLALPADGRYLVYPVLRDFIVKKVHFDLPAFLQDPVLARRYEEGSMLIARLCPIDYHRFHFPCDALPSKPRLINGHLYSVNPLALAKNIAILSENKRVVTELETDRFGTILYIEIGATSVGSIQQTFVPEKSVRKGEEKGYFEFGGSCLVLLFEKGQIAFDADLIEHSQRGLETRAFFGEGFAFKK